MTEQGSDVGHADFARWCAELSMDGAARDALWLGVVELGAQADPDLIEALVRLAFGSKGTMTGSKGARLSATVERFHAVFRGHEETYDPGAHREAQLLAACSLVHLFDANPLAPLAVSTASFVKARAPELPMDIAGMAENALRHLAAARRERPNLNSLDMHASRVAFELDAESLNVEDPSTYVTALGSLRDAVDVATSEMTSRQNESVRAIGRYVMVADEELQMLWWLIGGYSLDLRIPFDKVDQSAQALVFGRELANLTVDAPGPIAIAGLLAKAGLKSRGKSTIVSAVNAVSEDWAAETIGGLDPSAVTSPIHSALERRRETGAGEAWVPAWAAVSGLAGDQAASPIEIAELFYRERLLLRFGF